MSEQETARVTGGTPAVPAATGDSAVDAAVAALADSVAAPLEERLAVLERVHGTLQDRLADVEE